MGKKSIKYPHITIIGRIPNEDNLVATFHDMTLAEAKRAFDKYLYASEEMDHRKQIKKDWGIAYYLDFIFTSDSPIKTHNMNW